MAEIKSDFLTDFLSLEIAEIPASTTADFISAPLNHQLMKTVFLFVHSLIMALTCMY